MVVKYKSKAPSIAPKEEIHKTMRGMNITNKESETRNKENPSFISHLDQSEEYQKS